MMQMQQPGMFHIRVVNVRDLDHKDFMSKTDPYVVLKLGRNQRRTTVKNNAGKNADFNETFSFPLDSSDGILSVTVWDKDMVSRDDLIGFVEIPVTELLKFNGQHRSYQLAHKTKYKKITGYVTLEPFGGIVDNKMFGAQQGQISALPQGGGGFPQGGFIPQGGFPQGGGYPQGGFSQGHHGGGGYQGGGYQSGGYQGGGYQGGGYQSGGYPQGGGFQGPMTQGGGFQQGCMPPSSMPQSGMQGGGFQPSMQQGYQQGYQQQPTMGGMGPSAPSMGGGAPMAGGPHGGYPQGGAPMQQPAGFMPQGPR